MDVLSISATIFGFVALAGGAAGYFKASRGDSIIKYQATEIALRDAKVANLEKDLAKVTEQCAAKDATIAKLENHNKDLKEMSQGSPQLKRLTQVVERQAKAAIELTNEVKGLLRREKS